MCACVCVYIYIYAYLVTYKEETVVKYRNVKKKIHKQQYATICHVLCLHAEFLFLFLFSNRWKFVEKP